MTGSGSGSGLRFIYSLSLTRGSTYAARSKRMMYAGSSAAEQREHFCPGFTLLVLPCVTTVPATVCVQMGQYTNAFDSEAGKAL